MDTTIAVAHAGSGDLPDTFTQMSLPVSGSGRSIGGLATHGKHVECLLAKSPEHDPPVAASGQALSDIVRIHEIADGAELGD